MARAISERPILVGLVILLIGCTDTARTPSAPTLAAGLATSPPSATPSPTSSRGVTATLQPTPLFTRPDGRFTVYGFRAEDPITLNTFSGLEFPTGREL